MQQDAPQLADYLSRFSEKTLFKCDGGQAISYASVVDLSVSSAMQATRRKLVFCLCANEPGALTGYLALVHAGAVPLMLSSNIAPVQLHRLIDDYKPSFLWLPDTRFSELPGTAYKYSHLGYGLLAMDIDGSYEIHGSLALLLSTSGSTGSPRFVRLSYENVLTNALAIAQFLEISQDDVPITTLPPSYTYGLSIVHSHVVKGCSIALTNRTFFDRNFWDFFRVTKASSLGGVPYHYEMLKKLRFERMDLGSLRTLTQAGGRMDPGLSREFAQHCASQGIRLFTMYGQVEATARISFLSPENAVKKAGSIGRPIPGGELWLTDESGAIQEGSDASGQLVYRGPNVCMGYAEGYRDLCRGNEMHNVIETGDLAKRDADGDYYIIGRLKRFIKLFGHRVHLQDVENTLAATGYTTACTGIDDHLDIYLCGAHSESAKAIKSQLSDQLKITPSAIRVFGLDTIPRSESGKVLYASLEAIGGVPLA